MTTSRDLAAELDEMKDQLAALARAVGRLTGGAESQRRTAAMPVSAHEPSANAAGDAMPDSAGELHYSGVYRHGEFRSRWEPRTQPVDRLLAVDGERAAKIVAALGHKQRLDIIRAVLKRPMTGAELVELLNMGTTGQLYHHLKALTGADLLQQDDRGGRYRVPEHRTLPLMLLFAAASDLLDASDYLDMAEMRSNPSAYLGAAHDKYDPHVLLGAVLENCLLEHRAGHCSQVDLFVHDDRGATVADNGRGIPTRAFPAADSDRSWLQTVMTDLGERTVRGSGFTAPEGAKGIGIAAVNALSAKLQVETRRDGVIIRQEYVHGIPRSGLTPVGVTSETGTSVTFEPDADLFAAGFDRETIDRMAADARQACPELTVRVHG